MLELRKQGLYCEAGDFYIDPMGKVDRAVVTHAHSDHARRGAREYFTPRSGMGLLKARLGKNISVHGKPFGESFTLGAVKISFHPAGHILGSSQVRLETGGEVWVVSGDFKREFDSTCEPFEVIPCDVFVTEATFGTPAYRWSKNRDLGQEIFDWWEGNAASGKNSLLCAYSLGKTQRVLGLLAHFTDQAAYLDPAAVPITECYRQEGVRLLPTRCLSTLEAEEELRGALVIAPTSFLRSPRASHLGEDFECAFASGWMQDGGNYRFSSFDRGFPLSDHADWDDLVRTSVETRARRIYVQHRGQGALVRHLRSLGIEAFSDSELAKPKPRQLALF